VAWSNGYNGNNLLVATGGKDNVAVVWSPVNGDMLSRLVGGHSRDVASICFDPTDCFVLSASDDRRIMVWDAYTAEKCGILVGQHSAGVRQIAFRPQQPRVSPSKRRASFVASAVPEKRCILVSVGSDNRVLMWRPGSGLRWKRFVKDVNHKWAIDVKTGARQPMKARAGFKPIKTLACHPTQEWVIFSESADGRVMSTGQKIRFLAKGSTLKESMFLAKMDGSPVFCAGEAKLCYTFSNKKSKPARCIYSDFARGHYRKGWYCDGVPDFNRKGGGGAKKTWRCLQQKNVQLVADPRNPSVGRVPFHPPSERRFFCIHCGYNVCLECSGNDGHSNSVTCIDISLDGSFSASVSQDSTCILWNMKRLQANEPGKSKDPFSVKPLFADVQSSTLKSPFAHSKSVDSVKIAPDGLLLVTSSKAEFMSVRPDCCWPVYSLRAIVNGDFHFFANRLFGRRTIEKPSSRWKGVLEVDFATPAGLFSRAANIRFTCIGWARTKLARSPVQVASRLQPLSAHLRRRVCCSHIRLRRTGTWAQNLHRSLLLNLAQFPMTKVLTLTSTRHIWAP